MLTSPVMHLALADRLRAISRTRRHALYNTLAIMPGLLSDVRYDYEFWVRPDQRLTEDELAEHAIIVFGGPRGCGKTWAAVWAWSREIIAGRATRPRIVAATETDVDKTVVHGPSGICSVLPPEHRPTWIKGEGSAGVLRFRNGVDALCFSARAPEQLVGTAGDLDLYDDIAKWGASTEKVWKDARTSCRLGNGTGLVATTRRGATVLRKLLKGDVRGVLVKRPDDLRANRNNLKAGYFAQLEAEIGSSDFWRQELDDEDVSSTSPFAGLEFEQAPIRIAVVERGELAEVVVAVDPADGKGGDHDEWGVGAAGRRRADRHIIALDDASGSYDHEEGATAALDMCERWGARTIVVEGNRGTQVQAAIRAVHFRRLWEQGAERPRPLPEIIGVTAREGKKLRAGPVGALYKQGLLHHVVGLGALERQMREWDPDGPKRPRQDDRIDWLVHAAHHLADLGAAGMTPDLVGLAERVQRIQGRHAALAEGADALIRSDRVSASDPRAVRTSPRPLGMSQRRIL